jgi:hypothetical protein
MSTAAVRCLRGSAIPDRMGIAHIASHLNLDVHRVVDPPRGVRWRAPAVGQALAVPLAHAKLGGRGPRVRRALDDRSASPSSSPLLGCEPAVR